MAIMSDYAFQQFSIYEKFGPEAEPAFESASELEFGWGRNWGCSNDVGKLRTVLMHRPGAEINVVDASKPLGFVEGYGDQKAGWYWHSKELPNLPAMQAQHDAFVKLLKSEGVEVVLLDKAAPNRLKSVFTRDSCIGVKGGAIITRLARRIRRGEELPVLQALARVGCPVLHTIHGTGTFEGGGFAFINEKTAVCSVSVACNEEGARQVEEVLKTQGVELIKLHLSGYRIHIDGMFLMVDVDTAIVNQDELPYWFIEKLKAMKIRTIQLPPDESALSLNCLAVAPGRVIADAAMTPRFADMLDKAGITVLPLEYERVEHSGGGIHCSTAPLIRDRV
jgi:N-dimethylarginine dimethylaminohydrolase